MKYNEFINLISKIKTINELNKLPENFIFYYALRILKMTHKNLKVFYDYFHRYAIIKNSQLKNKEPLIRVFNYPVSGVLIEVKEDKEENDIILDYFLNYEKEPDILLISINDFLKFVPVLYLKEFKNYPYIIVLNKAIEPVYYDEEQREKEVLNLIKSFKSIIIDALKFITEIEVSQTGMIVKPVEILIGRLLYVE